MRYKYSEDGQPSSTTIVITYETAAIMNAIPPGEPESRSCTWLERRRCSPAKSGVDMAGAITSGGVTAALGYTPANKAGESFTGAISVAGSITATVTEGDP